MDERRGLRPAWERERRRGLSLLGLEVRRAIDVLIESREKRGHSILLETLPPSRSSKGDIGLAINWR